jgi:hypothetical protein
VAQQLVPLGEKNPRGTVRAGRGATSGSNLGGTSGAGWQGATIPAVVSRVPTVETVEPDSQRKSRSLGLGEAARGKPSSSKTMCREMIKTVCGEIKAAVAFVISGVAKEDTG